MCAVGVGGMDLGPVPAEETASSRDVQVTDVQHEATGSLLWKVRVRMVLQLGAECGLTPRGWDEDLHGIGAVWTWKLSTCCRTPAASPYAPFGSCIFTLKVPSVSGCFLVCATLAVTGT